MTFNSSESVPKQQKWLRQVTSTRRSIIGMTIAFLSGGLLSTGGHSENPAREGQNPLIASADPDDRWRNTRNIQTLLDSMPPGSQIDLRGQTVTIGRIRVQRPGLTITNGQLLGGPLQIGTDKDRGPYPTLDFTLNRISFQNDGSVETNAIEASCAQGISVTDCIFEGYNAVFFVRPQAFVTAESNHVTRVLLSRLRVKSARYVVYVPSFKSGGGAFSLSDVQLSNCPELQVSESHILAFGIDGAQISNNVMFMAGSNQRSITKRESIRIESGSFLSISGNHIFEAGLDGISLNKIQNAVVTNNQIGFVGQIRPGSGVRLTGGDTSGGNVVSAVISNNTIFMPSSNGITLGREVGSTSIVGNVIHSPGSRSRYYGEPSSAESEGISLDPDSTRSAAVLGNMITFGGRV